MEPLEPASSAHRPFAIRIIAMERPIDLLCEEERLRRLSERMSLDEGHEKTETVHETWWLTRVYNG